MSTPNAPTGDTLSPADTAEYARLAENPKTSDAQLRAFLRSRGFDVTDADLQAFRAAQQRKGAIFSPSVSYRTLEVEAPDGTVYEVQAPANATDAEVLERVQEYARPNGIVETVQGAVGSVVDGALPGAGRFVTGLGSALGNTLAAPLRDDTTWRPAESFEQGQADYDRAKENFGRDYPQLAAGLGWTGFGAGFMLPSAKVLRGGTLASGAGNGALTGAGYGALAGALNETGDGRGTNAALGALAGGTLGAAAAPIASAAAKVGGTLRRNVPGVNEAVTALGNIPRRLAGREPVPASAAADAQAERVLAREMDRSTIATGMGTGDVPASPANVAAEVARRQSLGVPAIPADVNEPLRRTLTGALTSDRRSALTARGVLASRQAAQALRVRGHVAGELGPAVDPIAEADRITRRAAAAAGPGYQAAYAQPVVITPEIERIMATPAFRDALPQALENIRNGLGDPQALGFRLDPAGNVSGLDTLSTEGFDQVIRAMRDAGTAAMDRSGFRPRNTTNSVHINARAGDLRDALAGQNEHYRAAVGGYADEMAVRDALERGQEVAKLSGHEINAQLRAMPQHAQEAWMSGARTALADSATEAGLRPGTNAALSVRQALGLPGAGLAASMGDPVKLQAVEAVSGRPGVLSRLDDRLEAEHQAFQTYAASATPKGDKGPSASALAEQAGKVVDITRKAATGNPLGVLQGVLLMGNRRGTSAFRGAMEDRTVGILSASEPAAVREGLEAVARRPEADRARRGVLHRRGANTAKVGALYAAAQSTDPVPLEDYGEAGPAEPASPVAPLYGRWTPAAAPQRPQSQPPAPDLSPIPKALADGRRLQGFDQDADGLFQPRYGFDR